MSKEKATTRILAVTPAGGNHQVVTVVGGKSSYRRVPCEECPWRVDRTGSFPAAAFRISANTAYDMSTKEFGCHVSGKDKPVTCAGFLLNGATHNLSTRLKAGRGAVDFHAVSDGGHILHASYRAMAIANGVDPMDEAIALCRD